MRTAGKVVAIAAVVVVAVGAAVMFIGRAPTPVAAIAPGPVTYQTVETQPAPAPAAPAAEVMPAVQAEPVEVITPEVQDAAQIAEDAAAVGMTSLADESQDMAMSEPSSSGATQF